MKDMYVQVFRCLFCKGNLLFYRRKRKINSGVDNRPTNDRMIDNRRQSFVIWQHWQLFGSSTDCCQASSGNNDHKKQQITKIQRENQNYKNKRLQNNFFAHSSFSPAPPRSCFCKDQRRQMRSPLQQTAEGSASAREDQLVSRTILFKQLRVQKHPVSFINKKYVVIPICGKTPTL